MAPRRSLVFSNVDPGLARAIEETSRSYKKHRVEAFSGRAPRPKNPSSLHPRGRAVDVNLFDPESGALLPNIGNHPQSAVAYQQYANAVYQWALENDPELAKELIWGGYFAGGNWPQDYMHFQRGGHALGGSWEGGFTPAVMKKLGLTSSGGLGDAVAQRYDPRFDTPSSGRPNLGGYPDSPSEGGTKFGGTGLGTPAEPLPPYPVVKKEKPKGFLEKLGEGLTGMGKTKLPDVPTSTAGSGLPSTAPGMPVGPSPSTDPAMQAWQRQQLALLMQRLNTGKLWG
jgi:hypothetical protein